MRSFRNATPRCFVLAMVFVRMQKKKWGDFQNFPCHSNFSSWGHCSQAFSPRACQASMRIHTYPPKFVFFSPPVRHAKLVVQTGKVSQITRDAIYGACLLEHFYEENWMHIEALKGVNIICRLGTEKKSLHIFRRTSWETLAWRTNMALTVYITVRSFFLSNKSFWFW